MYDFVFKSFEEMTPEDYERVGFKSGLEVHQQLLTDKKLFCRCPAGHYNNEEYNAEILRHMRPTLSELGEYDGTALMEFKTKKEITYRIHYETVCTYEMDDTPPFQINDQALDIALEVGMLFNGFIVDELHIARKQYLDGSIPTGFQRTAITCVGGKIPYKDRIINLIQMSIEEDSCREVSDIGHKRIYNTDRLGMPLIETVTYPEMKTPQEVAEVNEILRNLVRSTGKVRTGVGAGREDVNVSVTGGTRIEIKGVPSIKRIPLLTYNEAMRQWNLLRLREELKKRGVTTETFESSYTEVTKILKKTSYKPIRDAIHIGHLVKAVVLKGFSGLMNWQTQTDTFFSKEISDRVRVIACLTTLPNIIHSDNPSDTIASSEWNAVKKSLGVTSKDCVLLVWGSEMDTETGCKEIVIRAKEATIGIPSETRQALRDGTNGFERILPGPERMYPDTDLPPKPITEERLAKIKAQMPEPTWLREKRYEELGVPTDLVKPLYKSKFARIFDKAVQNGIEPKLAAAAIIRYPKTFRRMRVKPNKFSAEIFEKAFDLLKKGKIVKDGLFYVLKEAARKGFVDEVAVPTPASDEEIMKQIEKARNDMNKVRLINPEKYFEIFLTKTMDGLRGRANGSHVSELAKKALIQE